MRAIMRLSVLVLVVGLCCAFSASAQPVVASNNTTSVLMTTGTAAAQKPAYLSLGIAGMDYGLLQARSAVRLLVVAAIKAGAAFGQSYGESAVGVELSSGSTIALLVIQAPAGTTAVALTQQLTTNGPAIASRVLQLLRQVPGINSVLTGVLDVQVCGTSTDRAPAFGACFPTVPVAPPVVPVVPAPHASMPSDLNAAMVSDSKSSTEPAAHFQWSTFFTISLVGLVASVAVVSYFLSIRKPPTTVDEEAALVECVEE